MGVGYLTGQGGGGSNVKSIQRGTTILTAQSLDLTISSVDLNKSIVIMSYSDLNNSSDGNSLIRAKLTSATNINFYLGEYSTPKYIEWQVIEFNNVKSIQRGDFTTPSTTITAYVDKSSVTINSINTSKSLIFASFASELGYSSRYTMIGNFQISNATTITLAKGNSVQRFWHWQVIEFK